METWHDIVQVFRIYKVWHPQPDNPYSLLVAHTNTLCVLVMHIDDIASNGIEVL
jgi:bisphosphoglycerate-dependent phosphoglycerate mutase